ncbi:hypothetical protein J4E89_009738 [Alternaria sp. Ai002NY15]|nr:hypothetical protein J4E89_009738 [Alternaria sp. Ai002NY15]
MRLQAELIEIEELLRAKQLRDDGAEKPEQDFSTSLFKLNLERATKEGDKGHPNQMALMELAQQKLISYRFQEGIELVRTWDENVKRDLVVLTHEDHEEDNALSAWATPKLLSTFHYIFQSLRSPITTEAGDVYDYEDSKAVKSLTWLITLLATIGMSLLPSLIILWLFHVKRTMIRIWITMGATIIIGILLRIFTTATMKEIFGGTAANRFAAVEVVFIGSANGTYAGS